MPPLQRLPRPRSTTEPWFPGEWLECSTVELMVQSLRDASPCAQPCRHLRIKRESSSLTAVGR